MAEIFLCLTGEIMIKYIQTNAAVQVFNKSMDFCKNRFLKSYGIDLDMNNVNSVLYNILKEGFIQGYISRKNFPSELRAVTLSSIFYTGYSATF